jgi:seryl-tRNA synthetase
MPPPRENLGERIAGVEAAFERFERYERERWHKQDNDLTPLLQLPERLTREIGKLQGMVEGRINSVSKDIDRSIAAAIKDALQPLSQDMVELKAKVDELERQRNVLTGAKMTGVFIIQTLLAILTALGGSFYFGKHP